MKRWALLAVVAMGLLAAPAAAEPTADEWQLTARDADHIVDALGEVYGHGKAPDGWNEQAKRDFLTAAAKLYALSVSSDGGIT